MLGFVRNPVFVLDEACRDRVDADECPEAISISGTAACVNGISTPFLPPSDSSSMSPPPKFCTAVTLPIDAPVSSLTASPIKSA